MTVGELCLFPKNETTVRNFDRSGTTKSFLENQISYTTFIFGRLTLSPIDSQSLPSMSQPHGDHRIDQLWYNQRRQRFYICLGISEWKFHGKVIILVYMVK
jgi:hypothetical protein